MSKPIVSSRSVVRTLLAVTAAALVGAGFASPITPASADAGGVPCLWAGGAHRQGSTVYAGGWAFTCRLDNYGGARWSRDGAVGRHSTVPNPGATGNPAGAFSPGARQPGSSYNDYCVGSQLIDGAEDIYEVVPNGSGLMWRSVGPITFWDFESGRQPSPTWRTGSLCVDGVLI
ncbi:hypothetical protein [Nocardia sp. NPDC057030]|uniref:hypothetical protein n=1 Tax=unclassified Nocardia TaxID=2637762 RepID=UPI00363D3807